MIRPVLRSMLFVPGHKRDWIVKAPKFGADALILDLEDAVPVALKEQARQSISSALAELDAAGVTTFVRLNSWGTGHLIADLLAVVAPGLGGVLLPKVEVPGDVVALDRVLTELESERELERGAIEIVPCNETALGVQNAFEVCCASRRIRRTGGGGNASPGGDLTRSIGYTWTESGEERLYLDSRGVLAARAAGLTNILGGLSTNVQDLDLLRRVATRAKQFGANGSMVIHPSHVPVVNEIFSPSKEEIDAAVGVMTAMAAGIVAGDSAVRHRGGMVDYAHARSSLQLLRRAEEVGIPVPDYPELPMTELSPPSTDRGGTR